MRKAIGRALYTSLFVATMGVVLYAAGVTRISYGSALPSSGVTGNIFVKTGTGAGFYWWDGSAYSPVGGGSIFTSAYRNASTVDDGNSGTSDTIDWSTSNVHFSTLTGNVTYTFSNPGDSGGYVLFLNTGTGGFTATWPSAVRWPSGTAPTITAAADRVDVVVCRYLSLASVYYCSYTQNWPE